MTRQVSGCWPTGSRPNLPHQHPPWPINFATVALPHAGGCFEGRALGAERNNLAAFERRHEAQAVYPGIGPVGVDAEQV